MLKSILKDGTAIKPKALKLFLASFIMLLIASFLDFIVSIRTRNTVMIILESLMLVYSVIFIVL
ncbi:hypothetical protein, partial [Acidiplasma cupricumulans]